MTDSSLDVERHVQNINGMDTVCLICPIAPFLNATMDAFDLEFVYNIY